MIGYPDWYVDLLENKKEKESMKQVNIVETPVETEKQVDSKQQEWPELNKQEMAKNFKGKQQANDSR